MAGVFGPAGTVPEQRVMVGHTVRGHASVAAARRRHQSTDANVYLDAFESVH